MENTSNTNDVIKITSKKLLALKDSNITNDMMTLKSHELREKFSEEIEDSKNVRTPKCIKLDDGPLIEPLDYIWDTGGKHTRAMITQYLANLFGSTNNKIVESSSDIILWDSSGYEESLSWDFNWLKTVSTKIEKMVAGNITIDKIKNLVNLADTIDVSGALETNKVKDINKIKKFTAEIKKISNEN